MEYNIDNLCDGQLGKQVTELSQLFKGNIYCLVLDNEDQITSGFEYAGEIGNSHKFIDILSPAHFGHNESENDHAIDQIMSTEKLIQIIKQCRLFEENQ